MKKVIAAIGFCGLMSTSVSAMNLAYEVENGFTGMPGNVVIKLSNIIGKDHAKLKTVIGMCAENWGYVILIPAIMRYITRYYKSDHYYSENTQTVLDATRVELITGTRHDNAIRLNNYMLTSKLIHQASADLYYDPRWVKPFLSHTFDPNNPTPDPDGLIIIRSMVNDVYKLPTGGVRDLITLIGLQMYGSSDYLQLLTRILEYGNLEYYSPLLKLLPLLHDEIYNHPTDQGPLERFFWAILTSTTGNIPAFRKMLIRDTFADFMDDLKYFFRYPEFKTGANRGHPINTDKEIELISNYWKTHRIFDIEAIGLLVAKLSPDYESCLAKIDRLHLKYNNQVRIIDLLSLLTPHPDDTLAAREKLILIFSGRGLKMLII